MVEKYFQNNLSPERNDASTLKDGDSMYLTDMFDGGGLDHTGKSEKLTSKIEKENAQERVVIMKEARSQRLGILSDMFSRLKNSAEISKEKIGINKLQKKIDDNLPKPAQELISQMLDVSSIKMYAEAGRGKNLTGKELEPKDRVLSVLSAGTNDIAKFLFAYAASSGSVEYAQLGGMLYGTSWAFLLNKNGQKMMQNLKELASYYELEKVNLVLNKIEETFNKYRYPGFETKLGSINN